MKFILPIFLIVNYLNVYAQYSDFQKPDTISIHFDDNFSDTLIISGYLKEWGEFGGYINKIEIYRSEDELLGKFTKGYIPPTELDTLAFQKKYDSIIVLGLYKQDLLMNYFKKFNNFNIIKGITSNAPTWFRININGVLYERRDPTGMWNEFDKLCDELFKKYKQTTQK